MRRAGGLALLLVAAVGCAIRHDGGIIVIVDEGPWEAILPDVSQPPGPDADPVDAVDPRDSGPVNEVAEVVESGISLDTQNSDVPAAPEAVDTPADTATADDTVSWEASISVTPDADATWIGQDSGDEPSGCGDLQWNSLHCGNCGLRCADIEGPGTPCQAGQCLESPATCGSASNPCPVCQTDGDCWGYVTPGLTPNAATGTNARPRCCGGRCAPPGDHANCGACGNVCTSTQTCGWASPFDSEVSCF